MKAPWMNTLGLVAALGFTTPMLTGCEDGTLEEAGEDMDEALDDARDGVEDAADETGDAIDEGVDEIEDAAD